MDLRQRLIEARESAGMNQSDLARKLTVSTSTVNRIESGKRQPSADVIVRWLEACGYLWEIRALGAGSALGELAGAATDREELAIRTAARLLRVWHRMSERERRMLLSDLHIYESEER